MEYKFEIGDLCQISPEYFNRLLRSPDGDEHYTDLGQEQVYEVVEYENHATSIQLKNNTTLEIMPGWWSNPSGQLIPYVDNVEIDASDLF